MPDAVILDKGHIVSDPEVRNGRPCIAGSGIRVVDVVHRIESGATVDDVAVAYPHISVSDIYAAMAYYYDNKAAIDKSIADDNAFVEQMMKKDQAERAAKATARSDAAISSG